MHGVIVFFYSSLFFAALQWNLFTDAGVWAQIVTDYKHDQLTMVLDALERMHAHLAAAVVSNDPLFLQARFTMT